MNKFMKICLIAGGICILVGGGITTVAAAMGGRLSDIGDSHYVRMGSDVVGGIAERFTYDIMDGMDEIEHEMDKMSSDLSEDLDDEFREFDAYIRRRDEDLSEAVYTNTFSGEQARKLEVEVRRGQVVILPDSASDEIAVSSNVGMKQLSVSDEGDELKISVGSKKWNSDNDLEPLVYIHVPADYRFDEAELAVKMQKNVRVKYRSNEGPVIAAEGLKAGTLELNAEVGAISVTGGDTGKLEVDSSVGAVKYEGNTTGNVEVDSSVGAVKLKLGGKKTDYNYRIKCRVGSINLGGEGFSGLSSEKTIDNGAGKKMDLECSTGAVDVQFQ